MGIVQIYIGWTKWKWNRWLFMQFSLSCCCWTHITHSVATYIIEISGFRKIGVYIQACNWWKIFIRRSKVISFLIFLVSEINLKDGQSVVLFLQCNFSLRLFATRIARHKYVWILWIWGHFGFGWSAQKSFKIQWTGYDVRISISNKRKWFCFITKYLENAKKSMD